MKNLFKNNQNTVTKNTKTNKPIHHNTSLSTCEYSRTNGRMVVVAKKIASPNGEVNPDA